MAITAARIMTVVGADITDHTRKLNEASGHVQNFAKRAEDVGAALTRYVTLPLVAAGGAAVKTAADFDSNMAVLRVSSGATGKEIEQLSALARELGADIRLPGTSAADAAEAMTELSKAGLSVRDTMNAARGVLQLSAAGQLSNAAAAEVTANALNAFSLEGKEAVRVADLLAASANASTGEVVDMADALKMSAAVASTAGIPIEDLVTAISQMANAGIQGSDAGTSLKQMILSLQAPTDRAARLMDSLGIEIYDAQGAMLPMRQIIQNFSTALGGLTQQQRNAALAIIFGSDAVRAANVVLMQGVDAFDEMKEAVTAEGAAAELAAARNEGLRGVFDAIVSSGETALLAGIQPFKDELEALGMAVADTAERFSELDEGTQEFIVSLGLFAAAAGPALTVVGKLIIAFHSLTGALMAAPAFLADVRAGLQLIGSGAGALNVATISAAGLTAAMLPLAGAVGAVSLAFVGLKKASDEAQRATEETRSAFEQQVNQAMNAEGALKLFHKALNEMNQDLEEAGPLVSGFANHNALVAPLMEELSSSLVRVSTGYEEYASAMIEAGLAANVLTDREEALLRASQERGDAMDGWAVRMGALSREEFLLARATDQAAGRQIHYNAALEIAHSVMGGVLPATQQLAEEVEEVATATMDAADILDIFRTALDDAGWAEEQVEAQTVALNTTLDAASAAQAQLAADTELVAEAFARGAITSAQMATYMQAAQEGTLQLSQAQRDSMQAAVDYADAQREAAQAAQDHALAAFELAQQLKGASQAQIAAAMIGELKQAMEENPEAADAIIQAMQDVGREFGLVTPQSEALAGGVMALTEAVTAGALPAEQMGEALKMMIADARDGSVDVDAIVESLGGIPAVAEAAITPLETEGEKLAEIGEKGAGAFQAINDGITSRDWKALANRVWEQGLKEPMVALERATGGAAGNMETLVTTMTGNQENLEDFAGVLWDIVSAIKALHSKSVKIETWHYDYYFSFDLSSGLHKPMAAGGPVTAGEVYLVGERGPELFIPSTSGTIVPNHELANISYSNPWSEPAARGDIYITVEAEINTPLDVYDLAQTIADVIRDEEL